MARFHRIIVVTRRTRLQELLDRFVTEAQARFYIEHMGLSFTIYEEENATYLRAIERLEAVLPASPRHQVIERAFLPTFTFEERDLVVTLGNNGLVVNTAKYLEGQPIVGVNVNPTREEGIVATFTLQDLERILPFVLLGDFQVRPVTMAQATLNDGQVILAFNDLFIGHRSHQSARYRIEFDGRAEDHSSSGVIVTTGAGSTAWMRSVYAGALGVVRSICNGVQSLPAAIDSRFPWSADILRFAVREPWPSKGSQTDIVFGTIQEKRTLRIVSRMSEGGVIFSDGVESDAVPFNAGAVAEIDLALRKANIVVDNAR